MNEKKHSTTYFTLLFAVTYMVSYITRVNYAAIISAIEASTSYSRDALSMAVTVAFITYGAGQIVSGIFADKFSPKKIVSFGLMLTVAMNFLIPLCNSPYTMCAVWCVNGFAQSLMWPPLVRLMSALMSEENYKKATTRVNYGGNIGTMLVYLVSSLLLVYFSWKSVFIISAITGLVMLFFWIFMMRDINIVPCQKGAEASAQKNAKILSPLFVFIMIAIMFMGMLRDGVTTWMPSYIAETYNLANASAILTGCILPIFSILSITCASKIYISKFKNPMQCAGVFFGVGVVSLLALSIFTGKSVVLSLLFSALLIGSMHGCNLILVCMIPQFYKDSGKVSLVSGLLNSCTYIGSAISTYGIAVISQNGSWNRVIWIWTAVCVLGLVICLSCINLWNKSDIKSKAENT